MSEISPTNLDKRAKPKRTREISIRVNDYELLELKKEIEEVRLQAGYEILR